MALILFVLHSAYFCVFICLQTKKEVGIFEYLLHDIISANISADRCIFSSFALETTETSIFTNLFLMLLLFLSFRFK